MVKLLATPQITLICFFFFSPLLLFFSPGTFFCDFSHSMSFFFFFSDRRKQQQRKEVWLQIFSFPLLFTCYHFFSFSHSNTLTHKKGLQRLFRIRHG